MSLVDNTVALRSLLSLVNDLPDASLELQGDMTYYVSSSGSDDNDGSQSAPFKTFGKALSVFPKNLGGHKAVIQALSDISESISVNYFYNGVLELNMGSYTLTGKIAAMNVLALLKLYGNTYTAVSGSSARVLQFESCISATLYPYSGTTITINCSGGPGVYVNSSNVFFTISSTHGVVFNDSSYCVYAKAANVAFGGSLTFNTANTAIAAQQAAFISCNASPTFTSVTSKYAYQGGIIATGATLNPT